VTRSFALVLGAALAGRDVPNRTLTVPDTAAASYSGAVARWRDGSPRARGPSTASASVSILSDTFAIPELGRTRRVWVYLPPGYAAARRRYAALYLQDGQNVFDAATSVAGEWGVDETLDSLRALGDSGVIVVAVDHGGTRRMDEYSPWRNPQYGGGEGDRYAAFLVHTLKPYIDRHYRPLPDRLHTGVAGSSRGGLIALYAALQYPDVFGRVGVFSPEWLFRGDTTPLRFAWTRGAVCYEVFVRSFVDSNGDGIGDLNGLIAKLDYLTGLGASCIWLMPVAESPSYHGYDVSDYYRVEPAYGSNDDFKRLVAAAHRRGIKVLVDMVLNHTSGEHPDFEQALRDTTSPYRAWYRFSPTPLGKGPWGEQAWHRSPVRNEYYYGVFSSDMPDLNFATPAVREEAKRIATFWLRDMGVDGFRLDAVPYLVEQDGCLMGCAGTHAFLREYAAHIDTIEPGAYTVGEVWGNIDTVLPYYPDQLTSYFGFELADSLLAAVRRGTTGGMLAGYLRLQDTLPPYRYSPLLSNHDQTRVMTALGGDADRARLAATLLLTLPGLPFIYYGEEIGMTGDKPDPRLRTPMQWAPRPGVGFTTGVPWEVPQPDSLTTNVAVEDTAPRSLLNLYRRLIHVRKRNDAIATGLLVPLSTGSPRVVAYLRRAGDRAVLVVANLGSTPASGVSLNSGERALPPGTYAPPNLLGGPSGATLRVRGDGQIRGYVPVPRAIGARQSLVLDLVRQP
jgi:alpha-amylase